MGQDQAAPEQEAIAHLCRRLRDLLRTPSVTVWSADRASVVASAGPIVAAGQRDVAVMPVQHGTDHVASLAWHAAEQPVPPNHLWIMSTAAGVLGPLAAALVVAPPGATLPAAAPYGLVGVSIAIDRVRAFIPKAAATHYPVLIEGESGVGKELVARAVHAASPRRNGTFVAINCAALSDELLDAELFGHARGAFTGAALDRRGLFEEAHGGTCFLDEVSELSLRAQAKLLRVLQEGEVRRVGENAPRRIDVRVVAATNRPLTAEAAAGRFRSDLRFRLDVVRVRVPPLRERPDDIAVLAAHFWRQVAAHTHHRAQLAPSLLAAFAAYDWPGNARELQNVVSAIAVTGPARGLVRLEDAALPWRVPAMGQSGVTLEDARRAFEAGFVRAAFTRCGHRPSAVARELGVTRQGLAKLIARLGLREALDTAGTRRPAV